MSLERVKFKFGPHSADKDHTIMTGGTLNVDKWVISSELLSIKHYLLPGIVASGDQIHPGIHTLEHMLAYSVDTGSLRAQIANLTGSAVESAVLDVSPYVFQMAISDLGLVQ